jgi:rod shape-determining protein MreC
VRTKRQIARRRGTLALIVILVGLIAGLGWWEERARERGDTAAFTGLLREFLAPSVRTAGGLRNTLTADQAFTTEPLSEVGRARLRALEEENRRLRALLDLRDGLPSGVLVAEVIGRRRDPWQGHLILDKGTKDGVTTRMTAITPDGVAGKVVSVTAHTATIMPVTDTASGIGALLERTQTPGLLRGGRDGLCTLEHLPGTADVRVGDLVVTSGLGSIVPKLATPAPDSPFANGLPLGQVTEITREPAISARTAVVRPAVDLARVEMVVLIGKK